MHPQAIFVQLATSCNARCINCPHPFTYGFKGNHKKGSMSDEVWLSLIDSIKYNKYKNQIGLYLHHEPLIVKSLFSKIKDINIKTDAFVVLSTNGASLDYECQLGLLENRPKTMHINLTSADKDQYEHFTGLNFFKVFENTKSFIKRAKGKIDIEINCPVMPGVDLGKLLRLFPDVKVNTEYWANSRGGLLTNISSKGFTSRFNIDCYCKQPTQNFNVLWDGSVIACCMDWAHESKKDFPNTLQTDLFQIYNSFFMISLQNEFKNGHYKRYSMCDICSKEMGFKTSIDISREN
jgi:hypothetical protein